MSIRFRIWQNDVHDFDALVTLGKEIVRSANHPDDVYNTERSDELIAALGPNVQIPGHSSSLRWYLDKLWDQAYKRYLRRGGAIIHPDLHRRPHWQRAIEEAERLWRALLEEPESTQDSATRESPAAERAPEA
eukprot:GHVU01001627.1.p1 GENE.GHVU01001627.1~~GHVU01001627.1.p1  ORF type:complete len:133 (+),score=7.13 GHVU01001627.1:88-486(+)